MIDILEELLRKIRPYEKVSGSSDQAFDEAMDFVVDGLEQHGFSGALRGFKKAIQRMNAIEYDRSQPRPRVLIIGEYLLNFHPGANHEIERYLEKNGFEIIEARMTDVIRKTYFCQDEQIRTYHLKKPFVKKNWYHVANRVFDAAHAAADRIAKQHPLYTPVCRLPELVKESDPIIPHTFDAGEGVLIPGEILHHAAHGCRAFVILQPFGCLPNHVVGRGIVKKMREMYPDAQILLFVGRLDTYKRPLDLVPLLAALPENWQAVVIGSGALAEQLQGQMQAAGLDGRWRYIPSLPNTEVHAYYHACDVFVNFNDHEIFGMSLLEAMYAGCVPVARHAPGPDQIIEDGVSGLLLDGDAAVFAAGVQAAACNAAMGEAARQRIRTQFLWDNSARTVLTMLQQEGVYRDGQ